MASQKPILLIDNTFDRIACYPAATLTASSSASGREPKYLADGRRERTRWQAADDGAGNATAYVHTLDSDLGVGASAPVNCWWLDRGHNLWGRAVAGQNGNGSTFAGVFSYTLPALGAGNAIPVGGDPTTGWCVTEEGAAFTIASLVTPRVPRLRITGASGFVPAVSGLMVGKLVQLDGYSKTLDEDAATRTQRTEESDAGWQATGVTYRGPRKLVLSLGNIGGTSYDTKIRALGEDLFHGRKPAVICMDYGQKPERARFYQLNQSEWSFATSGSQRAGTLTFREVGAAL